MEEQSVLKALTALSQAHRLRVFRALVVAGQAGLTPGQIAEAQQIPAATLSFHLSQLSRAGLIEGVREGRFIRYSANYPRMDALIAFLTQDCCAGMATPPATVCLPLTACCSTMDKRRAQLGKKEENLS